MEISHPDFGVNFVPRDNRFHAAANGGPVVPVETLAVMKHRDFDVGHNRGPAESFRHDSLRDVAKAENVSLLDRRQVAYFDPGRPWETARFLGHRLPAKPVLDENGEPAAIG